MGSAIVIKDGLRTVFIIVKMPRHLDDIDDEKEVSIVFNPAPDQAREIAEQLMQYAKSVESGY